MFMLAKRLQKGNTIGIVNPSQPLNDETRRYLSNFTKQMEILWLSVIYSKHYNWSSQYSTASGTPIERADDINAMFSDKNISAIWCGLWWDTANWVLDFINYENIKKNPKLLLWKSDIDVLHNAIHKKTWLISFHCSDPEIWRQMEFDIEYTQKSFYDRLFNWERLIKLSSIGSRKTIVPGKAAWKVIGCNIPSLLKLAWTDFFPDFKNSIYCIETYKSSPSVLIPQLTQLKHLWVFDNINWMIIWNDYWFNSEEVNAERIITDYCKGYGFPIMKCNEFGHYQPHAFLPIWAKIEFDSDAQTIEIIEDFII